MRLTLAGKFWFIYAIIIALAFISLSVFSCEKNKPMLYYDFSHYSSIPNGKPFNSIDSLELNVHTIAFRYPVYKNLSIDLGIGFDAQNNFDRNPTGLFRVVIPFAAW